MNIFGKHKVVNLLMVTFMAVLGGCGGGGEDREKNKAPIATFKAAETVAEGEQVEFEVIASDPEGGALRYEWIQTNGPDIEYLDGSAKIQFSAPEVNEDTDISFLVYVRDPFGAVTQLFIDSRIIDSAKSNKLLNSQADMTGFVISEVSPAQYWDDNRWIKLFNGSKTDVNLANFVINTNSLDLTDLAKTNIYSFKLPNKILESGESVVIHDSYSKNYWSTSSTSPSNSITFSKQESEVQFGWYRSGFVELVETKVEKSIDFVRFGNSKAAPLDGTSWLSQVVGEELQENNGKLLVRNENINDTNSDTDWHYITNN